MSGKPSGSPLANYEAGCCVCGTYLNGSWLQEDASFLNDEEWIRNEQGKVLFLDAQELESKYIDTDEPAIWTTFFRLCLSDSSKGEFPLTSIGQRSQWKFSAPKDATKAFAGVPREDRNDFTKTYPNMTDFGWWNFEVDDERMNGHNSPIGIHMSCWKPAQWKIGPDLAEHLELFTAIALRTNFKILSEFGWGNTEPFKLYEMATRNNSSYDDMDKKRAEIAMMNESEWQGRRDYDPYRNPCTLKIIDSSRRIRKRVKSVAQPLIPDLPLEILFEILDFLDCKNASSAGIAFRIAIPDCYWRSRAALSLIEFDEIAKEDLNWQYLCVKYEAVYATDERFECAAIYSIY